MGSLFSIAQLAKVLSAIAALCMVFSPAHLHAQNAAHDWFNTHPIDKPMPCLLWIRLTNYLLPFSKK
jgi:hypothetical protein